MITDGNKGWKMAPKQEQEDARTEPENLREKERVEREMRRRKERGEAREGK